MTGTSFSALIIGFVALVVAIVGVVELEGSDDDNDESSTRAAIGDVSLRSSPDAIEHHEYMGE